MGAPADRLNRFLVGLVGLLLLAAGVLALIRSFGGFGARLADDRMLTKTQTRFMEDSSPWSWIVVAVVGVLLALLALRWLLAQLRTDRLRTLDLEPDPRKGATTLHAGAVTTALCEEIESYRGVTNASARLLHDARQPDLVLSVALDARADVAATRSRIETAAVGHARQALGVAELPTRLTLKPAPGKR